MSPHHPTVRALYGVLPAAALALLVGAGCSAKQIPGKDIQDPPTPINYTVDFLNQQNAIGSALIQVSVFKLPDDKADTTARVAYCNTLKSRRQNNQPLEAPEYTKLGETPVLSPCDLVSAAVDGGGVGRLDVPYGNVAVLVVSFKSANQGVLIGCATGEVKAEASEAINVRLDTLFDRFTAVGSFPGCNRLADRCNGATNCPPR